MGDISKNFSYMEFVRSAQGEEAGIDNRIPSAAIANSSQELTLTVLQPLRNYLGAPININSGYRCEDLNKLLGGAKTSQHRKGEAADIRSPFFSPYQIASIIVSLGLPFDQLILYPTFVHISHKLKGKQRGQILYNHRYNGEKI